jgi:limonene-1,2-epoxide hydrolase
MKHNFPFTRHFLFTLLLSGCFFISNAQKLTKNKIMVMKYMDAFNSKDHVKILNCLSDDIIWECPGLYSHKGKTAFEKEIENEGFIGNPLIKVLRMTEENNVVIAEGKVQAKTKNGTIVNLVFCDVFEMQKGIIEKLTSYLMSIPENKH